MTRRDGISLACGFAWGGIAYVLGSGALDRLIWGGVLVSPLIGLAIGRVAAWLRPSSWLGSKLGRAFASVVGLYAAVSLFGLAVGVYDLATGDIRNRIASAVVIQAVLGVLWGATFTGYFVILWPLAYLNHALLWRLEEWGVESGE